MLYEPVAVCKYFNADAQLGFAVVVAGPQGQSMDHLLEGVGVVLLQRETPEHVNMAVAEAAARAGVPVLQVSGFKRAREGGAGWGGAGGMQRWGVLQVREGVRKGLGEGGLGA